MSEIDEYDPSIEQVAYEWRILLSSGDATDEDRVAFERWRSADKRHDDAYDRATSVWAALAKVSASDIRPRKALVKSAKSWSRVLSSLSLKESPHAFAIAALLAFLSVASIAAFLGQSLFQNDRSPLAETVLEQDDFASATGQVSIFELSDGSKLTLGADTVLKTRYTDRARYVELDRGSAVFDVAADTERPFIVQAGLFEARVLGTVFDLRRNGDVTRLSVAEGEVRASYPLMQSGAPSSLRTAQTLIAGEQVLAQTEAGLFKKEALALETFAAWREHRLIYIAATLEELVADASRYSDRPLRLEEGLADAIGDKRVTLSFDGQDLESMLATLPDVFPISVDQSDPDIIRILKRE
ncbi:MAG: FecR domain-containing protein [Pseudomonadota bacterium]